MGYEPKIYRDEGGDRMVVGSGGKIVVESGGAIESEGTTYVVTEPMTHLLRLTQPARSCRSRARMPSPTLT